MNLAQYLHGLRTHDQVSWRAMWLGCIAYKPDADKAAFYEAQRRA